MAAYLRHKIDGRIYIYTDLLARDSNLEPYDPTPAVEPAPEAPAAVEVKPRVKRTKVTTEAAVAAPTTEVTVEV